MKTRGLAMKWGISMAVSTIQHIENNRVEKEYRSLGK
jgi:hypothetical protein